MLPDVFNWNGMYGQVFGLPLCEGIWPCLFSIVGGWQVNKNIAALRDVFDVFHSVPLFKDSHCVDE